MSQENVEIVRALTALAQKPEGVALLASGDFDFTVLDPGVEWDATQIIDVVPDLAEVYRGLEGVRTYWRRWMEAWRDLEFEIQDIRDTDDDVVVLICNQRQWGRHTGIVTEVPPFAMAYTFRNGKVVRVRVFPDQEKALGAVGLAE
jgi:ketosteroid isomerase-like protein